MAQGNTRAGPVVVNALRSSVWKRSKLRGGWDSRAGVRNKGGLVVVGVWGRELELLAYSYER